MLHLYYESFDQPLDLIDVDFWIKLNAIQNIVPRIEASYLSKILDSKSIVKSNNDVYILGTICWSCKIPSKSSIPSKYFINVITNTVLVDDYIINPPINLDVKSIDKFKYVPIDYNKILIIDALMQQGSHARYNVESGDRFVYSEHSGVLVLSDQDQVTDIVVSAQTNRIENTDSDIYLPINTKSLENYEFLFHTHPNTITLAGRLTQGIIYEFPSANDIFNFVKYYTIGKAQASIIVAPEGLYVIRVIRYIPVILSRDFFYKLQDNILKWEREAIDLNSSRISMLQNPDVFHKYISRDFTSVTKYNDFIHDKNLYIEYYPRIKINNEWQIPKINLQYVKKFKKG